MISELPNPVLPSRSVGSHRSFLDPSHAPHGHYPVTTRAPVVGFLFLLAVSVAFVGGLTGLGYAAIFVLALVPGWPIGGALCGHRHPARWIAGSLVGYGLTAAALWIPIAVHQAWWAPQLAAWLVVTAVSMALCRRVSSPLVTLPPWTRDTTIALLFVLTLVPVLVTVPFSHIGQVDEEGGHRYRAYFTADFVWHEALTAEIARFSMPPRNPYLASQPLHYYWAYYLLPASATAATTTRTAPPPIETYLAVNALGAGLLFVGAIFLAAWAAVPHAGAVAAGVAIALLAASAEGFYALSDAFHRHLPFGITRNLNIDAITSWFFSGLTIDGLPRSLWYGPQHATSLALGLTALTIAARSGRDMRPAAAAIAGLSLGLGLMMSPFPSGVMLVTYGLAILCDVVPSPRSLSVVLRAQIVAAALALVGLAWCVANGTFEGAGGAVEFGLSRAATRNAGQVLGLALGPALLPALAGLVIALVRGFPRELRPAVVGVALAAGLYFGVTLVLEPIWVGWRAGAQFLVTAPALIALAVAASWRTLGRATTAALLALLFAVGLPTTVLDWYNAQDTDNLTMGPGFRWTVRVSAAEREALTWIETHTPREALVQMSLKPRGRETWSLIPSFARRRMAAGLPISLLRTPEYDAVAERADRMYATPDLDEAAAIARDLDIDFIYVGRVERDAFGAAADKFAGRADLFGRVFANDEAAVYVVF